MDDTVHAGCDRVDQVERQWHLVGGDGPGVVEELIEELGERAATCCFSQLAGTTISPTLPNCR